MRIGVEDSQRMFSLAGVRRDVLLEVLREMGPVYLKGTLKREWSLENPTRNFCYVVSERLADVYGRLYEAIPHRLSDDSREPSDA